MTAYIAKHKHLFVFLRVVETHYDNQQTALLEYAKIFYSPVHANMYINTYTKALETKRYDVKRVKLRVI